MNLSQALCLDYMYVYVEENTTANLMISDGLNLHLHAHIYALNDVVSKINPFCILVRIHVVIESLTKIHVGPFIYYFGSRVHCTHSCCFRMSIVYAKIDPF